MSENPVAISDLITTASGIPIETPIDPTFMEFNVRVTAHGLDEGLNGERNDPRIRNYVDKVLPIDPDHVDPEKDFRQRPEWLEVTFHAGETLAEKWEVLPQYQFLVSHLEPLEVAIPATHAEWGKRQTYAFIKYQEQHIAQRFRLYKMNALVGMLEMVSWRPAEEFLELARSGGEYRWPDREDFDRIFSDKAMKEPLTVK